MRLWSLSPTYLDRAGLLAVWREGLLAQLVLLQGAYKECLECIGGTVIEDEDNESHYIEQCSKCKGTGKIKTPYYNHPQLLRFQKAQDGLPFVFEKHKYILIGSYLTSIYLEAKKRGYNFDKTKIHDFGEKITPKLTVTKGQLEFEFKHLQNKLEKRSKDKYWANLTEVFCKERKKYSYREIEPHPLFKVVKGDIEQWEKIKEI